ncbi:hypothetical protein D8B45_00695 [Candidatus Gracilibacteria bacterium]|nr:MAG: hypothetical protein D8B45_00695 [Candidatus Gracilibacteria bacterium]
MFFHLTGIKDIADRNYSLEFLIEGEDISSVKQFLADQKVIVLGLEHFTNEPQTFGAVYLDVESKKKVFRIVGKFDTLEEFLAYFVKLQLKIVDANSFVSPLEPQKVQSLLQQIYQKQEEQERLYQQAKEKKAKQAKLNFQDKKLARAYEAIDQIISQIDQLLAIGGKNIPPMTLKNFDDMRGAISKLRLATNYDKIIEELHKAMNLIVETQDLLLGKLDAGKIFTVVPQSTITNIEVIREQTRLAKARLLTALGAQLSGDEVMYSSLGYLKTFTQYLRKDIRTAMDSKLTLCRLVFQGAELLLLFFLLEVVIFSVFDQNFGLNLGVQRVGIILIYGGVLAGLLRIVNEYFRPQTVLYYLFFFLGIVAIYFLIIYLIKLFLVL